ncbi:LysR family transcriptional regulator [Ancylobacter pratisalsi]|uniref:LysR family transcriptional regulator n=1 Tax=Ancylobacter pratisalsi TaxID=1745854 RepID=A0A6P1YU58_9HYPH|nr:LysR family transcriptional regulator [Ancylobacter pratisalsi]QIB36430.1 LysR family transcriptional regulator [Ancylobacter pratisalsi]
MSALPNSRDIEAFNVVAMELSFRRAAERLAIDQSALSRRIRQMEELLGYQLIRRTTREVSLTAAGEIFHERTRLLGSTIQSAVHSARIAAEGKKGQLRVGYMSFAAIEAMPRVVHKFTRLYPEVDLTLKYIRTQGQKIDLARNDIDVGFMLGPFTHPQFETQPISLEPLVAVLPMEHRLSTRESVTLEELARFPLVLGSMSEWDFFRPFVVDIFARAGISIEARYEISDAMGILGLVGSGIGVSVYSHGIVRFQPRTVVTKPIADASARIETLLVWNRAYRSHALTNFIGVARSIYGREGIIY